MIRYLNCVALFFVLGIHIGNAQGVLNRLLNVNIKQQPLEQALFLLMDQANIDLSFSNDIVPDKTVSLRVKNQSLKNILDLLLRDTEIRYRLLDNQVVLYLDQPTKGKRFTISGFVEDARTGERLINVSIFDTYSRMGTTTNAFGFYSLTLDPGTIALKFSYLGYLLQSYNSDLQGDIEVDVQLKETVTQLATVVIGTDSLQPEFQVGTGVHEMNEKNLEKLPGFGGERDIIRSLHLLPGVQTGTDGIGGISIRGGSPDENLILIDDVPVYNFTHGAGLYSIIHSDAIQKATLYKSEFPARYNGRLSSILDIRTKDGNKKHFEGSASVNLLGLKAALEGPIIPGKSSFFVSGRKSLVNWYLSPISANEKKRRGHTGETLYNFYDFNLKLNHSFSPANRLFLSIYKGKDDYEDNSNLSTSYTHEGYNAEFATRKNLTRNIKWDNTTASLRWNSVLGNQLFANTTLIFSNLDVGNHYLDDQYIFAFFRKYGRKFEDKSIFGTSFVSSIKDFGGKIDLNYLPSPNHNLKIGGHYTHHFFRPGSLTYDENSAYLADFELSINNESAHANEFGFYLEDEIQLNENLVLNAGLTYVDWQIEEQRYQSIQPRLALNWKLGDAFAFKAGYSRMEQFIHRLFRSNLGLPTDLWVPSTPNVGPKNADVFSAGLDFYVRKNTELSIGAFYKKLNDLIEYSEGANFINNWEENVTIGQGNTYGLEFQFNQNFSRSSLNLAYTWSFTNRQFDNINFGKVYPYRFDRRHNANLNFNHQVFKWLDFSASWVFNTGFAFTVPRQQYFFVGLDSNDEDFYVVNVLDYGDKNEFRMPDYHRLDLNLRGKWKSGKLQHSLNFGVYNAYDRRNPLYYRIEKEEEIRENEVQFISKYVEAWLIPIVPHFDYTIRF